MYDVACTLARHLKGNQDHDNLLKRMTLALPSFHDYGHNAACQVNPQLNLHHACMFYYNVFYYQARYSPLQCQGIGLSDGEVMERMWSYLRRYTKMTKEMRPSHRIDILSHALLYYGHLTKKMLHQ